MKMNRCWVERHAAKPITGSRAAMAWLVIALVMMGLMGEGAIAQPAGGVAWREDPFFQLMPHDLHEDTHVTRLWKADDLAPGRSTPDQQQVSLRVAGQSQPRMLAVDQGYVPLARDGQAVTIALPGLPIGLYSLFFYGSVDPAGREELPRIWRPCPMVFELLDGQGKLLDGKRLLAKQSLKPRLIQAYHLHVDKPGGHSLRLSLGSQAMESLRLMRVVLIDQLAGLPDEAVKRSQNLESPAVTMQRLAALDSQRLERDKAIWNALPPLNVHLQVSSPLAAFAKLPAELATPEHEWQFKEYADLRAARQQIRRPFASFDLVNKATGQSLSHDDVLAGLPLPGDLPDDGTGVFLTRERYPSLPHDIYYAPRAMLLGWRVRMYLGMLGGHDYHSYSLAKVYFETGEPNAGHDAAMALVRLAYDAPALEMLFHEIRLSTHSPDMEYNRDWSATRNGKYFYQGWSGSIQLQLMTTYDQLFPYIQDNQVFADAVHRFIPWINTPQDVVAFLDRHFVFAGVRDFRRRLTRAAPVEDLAARVLGPHKLTEPFFDLCTQQTSIYPYTGTYQEIYASALSRSGAYHIGSFAVYALGSATDTLLKASLLADAKRQGMKLSMDLSDVNRYTKVRAASDFLLDLWIAGGFPLMVGDASGGPHTPPDAIARLKRIAPAIEQAFALTGDPRHAYLLHHHLGSQAPAVVQAAQGQQDPILHARSRVVADYAAILEMGSHETDLVKKSAATIRLGTAQGHAHADHLDLNLFGLGMPMAVDLACRAEGGHWSRPPASWSYLHNHAIAHDSDNPKQAGNPSGEPWLRSFGPQLVRASYASSGNKDTLQRDVMLMQVGDSSTVYALDIQRLAGRSTHTWCFHGCESDDLQLNIPMEDKTVRWIDRMLPGSHKVGQAGDTLQATWTMTRQAREFPHQFMGGGVVKTVAAEQATLGPRYDESLPPARLRATLLGRQGDAVMQGSPYSQPYNYAFPFLWVQHTDAKETSVYPALYEWYRGDVPTIAQATLVRQEPLTIHVTTRTGQRDVYTASADTFSAVSRDAAGVRFVKMAGLAELADGDVQLKADRAGYEARILSIDYPTRSLTLSDDFPGNPSVVAGNDLRKTWLPLKGQGRSFTYTDDLLVHEGRITSLKVVDGQTIKVETNQRLFHSERANRHPDGFTQVNEDHTWAFRGGKAVHRPAGNATLTEQAFTDANGDGFVNLKTYEIGQGDHLWLPAEVTIERQTDGSFRVLTNVAIKGSLAGRPVNLGPKDGWQAVP